MILKDMIVNDRSKYCEVIEANFLGYLKRGKEIKGT
jgi:hypothetical protein